MEWAAVPATSARALLGTEAPGEVLGRGSPRRREAGRRDRMGGHVAHGAQKGGQDLVQVPDEGREELGVGAPVRSRAHGPRPRRPARRDTARVPPRGWAKATGGVSSRTPWADEIDVPEGGRGQQQRVHRRADVVAEAGQRQRGGAAAASGLVGCLVDVDRQAGAGQEERGDQPVGARTHDDGIRRPHRADHSFTVKVSAAPMTGTGLSAKRQTVRSTSTVGAVRSMVEERDLARPGHGPQADRVLGGGMAERPFSLHLLGPEMGVVDQEIDVAGPAGAPTRGTRRSHRARVRAPSGNDRECRRRTNARR